MATTNRAVRVSDDVWQTAVAKAAEEGTTVTAVVCKALEAFNRKPAPKRRKPATTGKVAAKTTAAKRTTRKTTAKR